jgi:hypothetical protein
MAIERIHLCYECIFLTSDAIGRWICTRPDGTGNYKAHPYVGACSEHFKPKSKNENKKENKL